MKRTASPSTLLAVIGLIMLASAACTRGQTLRGTTSLAVKAALSDNHINYKGDITCTGNNLPINCTGTTTDGKPITGTLAPNGNGCVIVVTVGGQQIARESGGRCK